MHRYANIGFVRVSIAALACTLLSVVLSGCALNSTPGTVATATAVTTGKSFMAGNLHGGQQPVFGASVKLWAAGTSGTGAAGYGSGASLIATTATAADGSFSFNNNSGVSPCTTGQYLYVTAQGGKPDGANTNSALAMMAALPTTCNATTGNTFVFIDEVTTIAAVWSLQQFMTINPGGATPWQVGAPASNVTGLANAFLMTSNLATLATGVSEVTSKTTTLSSVAYTTSITPDSTKMNTLANILASCVNTTDGASTISNVCAGLFSDATPSGSAAPKDTLQVAYYLATNPAGLTMNQGSYSYAPQYLCATYVTSQPPFQPTLTCSTTSPYDWTIGVSYKMTNSANATVNTQSPGSIAIDGAGNIWLSTYATAGATAGQITGLNVTGQSLITPVTATTIASNVGWNTGAYTGTNPYPLGAARNDSLAVDTNGNVWSANYYTTSYGNTNNTAVTGGVYQAPIAMINPTTGVSTGYLVGSVPEALAIDGSNNVFVTNITTTGPSGGSGRYYASELIAGSPATYSTFYTGVGRFTNVFASMVVDGTSQQYATAFNGTCANTTLYRYNTAYLQNTINTTNATVFTTDGAAITLSSTSSPTTCATNGAPDAAGNLWAISAGNLEYIVPATNATTPSAPTALTSFVATGGTSYGGLNTATGVAVDGLGNVWVANSVAPYGYTELTPTTSNGTTTVVAKSPSGTGINGFGTANGYPKLYEPVIDGSGNVWAVLQSTATNSASLYGLVGGAAPVVTPKALAVKNGAIGARP